jgi:hypothetical protein
MEKVEQTDGESGVLMSVWKHSFSPSALDNIKLCTK